MSRIQDRAAVLQAQTQSLSERLSAIGVPPLNKEWVAHAMRASALGMKPNAWKWRVERRARGNRLPESWKIFHIDDYLRLHTITANEFLMPTYGVPMPSEILYRVSQVRRLMPQIRLEVHALISDDPYVFAIEERYAGAQELDREAIGGWYGRGRAQQVFLGK